MRARVFLFEGFDHLDIIAPYEMFWAGGLASDRAVIVESWSRPKVLERVMNFGARAR